MPCRRFRSGWIIAIMLTLTGIAGAGEPVAEGADESLIADDGWRRTDAGWEHVNDWPRSPREILPGHVSATPARRLPLHPLTFTLLQGALILIAYICLPPQPAEDLLTR